MRVGVQSFCAACAGCHRRCRATATETISHPWFDRVILLFILANCVFLCMDDVNLKYGSDYWQVLRWAEFVFTWFFFAEMLLKLYALGPRAYLKSGWNKLDGFIVVTSVLNFAIDWNETTGPLLILAEGGQLESPPPPPPPTLGIVQGNEKSPALMGLRSLRALRPLRTLSRVPGLQVLVTTIVTSLPKLSQVVMLCAFLFMMFGILAIQFWQGTLRSTCNLVAFNASRTRVIAEGLGLANHSQLDTMSAAIYPSTTSTYPAAPPSPLGSDVVPVLYADPASGLVTVLDSLDRPYYWDGLWDRAFTKLPGDWAQTTLSSDLSLGPYPGLPPHRSLALRPRSPSPSIPPSPAPLLLPTSRYLSQGLSGASAYTSHIHANHLYACICMHVPLQGLSTCALCPAQWATTAPAGTVGLVKVI